MADSPDDTSLPRSSGLGRILSRRPASTPAAAAASPANARVDTTGAGMALLQRLFVGAEAPEPLLAAFAQGLCSLPGELGDMGQRLHSAAQDKDWARYGRLLRQLIDKYIRTIEQEAPGAANNESSQLRDLLGSTLDAVLASLLQHAPALAQQAQRMGEELRTWRSGQALQPIALHLRELCHQVGVRSAGLQEQHELLLNLFALLLDNITELLDDQSWLHGQVKAVRQLLAGPMDSASLDQARNELREVIYRQGLLRQGIGESKQAMKDLMVDFVQQVDGMATETGEYHDRIASYAIAVRQARSIADLNHLLHDVLQDTARVQAQAARARDHLANARAEAKAAELRVQQLERELEEVGSQLRTDPLTGALNRRGLEAELGAAMTATAGPLSVAVLDLDHFSHTNASYGHAGGDRALRHLVGTAQSRLGNQGQIARLGGDEFVLILSGMPLAQAEAQLRRLQEALAQRPFLHGEDRVHVRFSAGAAQWQPGESLDALLQRADRALYAAKQAGRDQVRCAE